MSEYLLFDGIKFNRNVELEDILNTPDDSDIGNFIEVDLKCPGNMKHRTKNFRLVLKIKKPYR